MADRLRPLWNFDDLDASERRLTAQLAEEATPSGRAEVLTQLARVEALRGDFDRGEQIVDEAEALAGESEVARARVDLERGRLRRSSGNVEASLPLFESAFAVAMEASEIFIAADAAHMAALAAGSREGYLAWTERGIELAENAADPADRYWLGPLLNNLGWEYYDAGEYDEALRAFERALEERERDSTNRAAIELALFAVAKALRVLGRATEGAPLLERAVSSAAEDKRSDAWVHEELAETYAALGRQEDAREQARIAIPLLSNGDPDFTPDSERAERLRTLAAAADTRGD